MADTKVSALTAATDFVAAEVAGQQGGVSKRFTTAIFDARYQLLDSDLTSWAGVTRASGYDTFAATPSSANLATLLTDETGSGANVFGTSPTIGGSPSFTGTNTFSGVSTVIGASAQLIVGDTTGVGSNANPSFVLGQRASGASETIGFSNGAGGYRGNFGLTVGGNWDIRIGDITTNDLTIGALGALTLTGGAIAGVGALTTTGLFTLTGGQIAFPAAQNASADANTLDDYEEGTFTPRIDGTTAAGAGTYSIQLGAYTKIGRQVTVRGHLVWSAHTGTGNILIANLPFTSANDGISAPAVLYIENLTFAATYVQAFVNTNATTISPRTVATGAAPAAIPMDTAATITFFATYFV